MARITKEDLNHLLENPSGDARAEAAEKISRDFSAETLSDTERLIAEDIFRMMAKDAEIRVRQALAINLKKTPLVPHDVAAALAHDVDEVSLPILEFSEVLDDDDLVSIIGANSKNVDKQRAIASRSHVSDVVSSSLIDAGHEDVVHELIKNEGAEVSEKSMQKVVSQFGENERIQEPLIGRQNLPITIAERLVTMVSDRLRDELVSRGHISAGIVNAVVRQSQESATIGLLGDGSQERDVETLVDHLYANNRLSESLIYRALCLGDISFFEAAMAKRAGVNLINARILIHDSGTLGLEAIYRKAAMPKHFFLGIRAALAVAGETDLDGGDYDRERYSRRMIERVLTQYGDLGVEFDSDDLDYLMGRMLQLPSEQVLHQDTPS